MGEWSGRLICLPYSNPRKSLSKEGAGFLVEILNRQLAVEVFQRKSFHKKEQLVILKSPENKGVPKERKGILFKEEPPSRDLKRLLQQ